MIYCSQIGGSNRGVLALTKRHAHALRICHVRELSSIKCCRTPRSKVLYPFSIHSLLDTLLNCFPPRLVVKCPVPTRNDAIPFLPDPTMSTNRTSSSPTSMKSMPLLKVCAERTSRLTISPFQAHERVRRRPYGRR